MQIGVPAETRPGETRVAATPETVKKLAAGGRHAILVQSGAGVAASVPDREFEAAGAKIVPGPQDFSLAEVVLKCGVPRDSRVGLYSAARSSWACSILTTARRWNPMRP